MHGITFTLNTCKMVKPSPALHRTSVSHISGQSELWWLVSIIRGYYIDVCLCPLEGVSASGRLAMNWWKNLIDASIHGGVNFGARYLSVKVTLSLGWYITACVSLKSVVYLICGTHVNQRVCFRIGVCLWKTWLLIIK